MAGCLNGVSSRLSSHCFDLPPATKSSFLIDDLFRSSLGGMYHSARSLSKQNDCWASSKTQPPGLVWGASRACYAPRRSRARHKPGDDTLTAAVAGLVEEVVECLDERRGPLFVWSTAGARVTTNHHRPDTDSQRRADRLATAKHQSDRADAPGAPRAVSGVVGRWLVR